MIRSGSNIEALNEMKPISNQAGVSYHGGELSHPLTRLFPCGVFWFDLGQ